MEEIELAAIANNDVKLNLNFGDGDEPDASISHEVETTITASDLDYFDNKIFEEFNNDQIQENEDQKGSIIIKNETDVHDNGSDSEGTIFSERNVIESYDFCCNYCKIYFKNKKILNQHNRIVHTKDFSDSEEEIKPYNNVDEEEEKKISIKKYKKRGPKPKPKSKQIQKAIKPKVFKTEKNVGGENKLVKCELINMEGSGIVYELEGMSIFEKNGQYFCISKEFPKIILTRFDEDELSQRLRSDPKVKFDRNCDDSFEDDFFNEEGQFLIEKFPSDKDNDSDNETVDNFFTDSLELNEPIKRGRGRPKKHGIIEKNLNSSKNKIMEIKRKVGRPSKRSIYSICDICHKEVSDVDMHKEKAHNIERTYTCEICNVVTKKKIYLIRHKYRKHKPREKNQLCNQCGKSFFEKDSLKRHMKGHDEVYAYSCPEKNCAKGFIQKEQFLTHLYAVHNKGGDLFNCEFCPETFPTRWKRNQHIIKIHRESARYPCGHGLCNKAFQHEAEYKTHVMIAHTGERNIRCPYQDCQRGFSRTRDLNDHISCIHKKEKTNCSKCGKSYSKPNFRKHKSICGEEVNGTPKKRPIREFVCEQCGSMFHSAVSIKLHKMSHTGERPFSCNSCPKSFKTKHSLEIHKKFHTDSSMWPYHCVQCDKKFPHINYIKLHNRQYHLSPNANLKKSKFEAESSTSVPAVKKFNTPILLQKPTRTPTTITLNPIQLSLINQNPISIVNPSTSNSNPTITRPIIATKTIPNSIRLPTISNPVQNLNPANPNQIRLPTINPISILNPNPARPITLTAIKPISFVDPANPNPNMHMTTTTSAIILH